MDSKEINDLLEKAGVTQTDIAKSVKKNGVIVPVSPSAVNQVIKRKQTSRRIQDMICEVIGKSYEEVWA